MDDSRLREIPFHKETIYEGSILHVEKWQVTCPNGHPATREIVVSAITQRTGVPSEYLSSSSISFAAALAIAIVWSSSPARTFM